MGVYVDDIKISEPIVKVLTLASGMELIEEDGELYGDPCGSCSLDKLIGFVYSNEFYFHVKKYPLDFEERLILNSLLSKPEIVWA